MDKNNGVMSMKLLPILLCILLHATSAWANETYDKTLAGKSCKEESQQQINCTYKIGKDLEILIAGIGLPDTGITFAKSDIDGDYYASFGMQHLCVIIKSGKDLLQGFAFISPQNGKVYPNWEACQSGL